MGFKLSHKSEPDEKLRNYASHQPILLAYAEKIHKGKIIEYGCGRYSTGLLHEICRNNENELITVESDPYWMSIMKLDYPGFHWHQYIEVKEFADLLDMKFDFSCDLAFIDSATWGSRLFCLQETQRAKHNYVTIMHDCDFIVNGHPERMPGYIPPIRKSEAKSGEGRFWFVEKQLWPPTAIMFRKCMYSGQTPIPINYDIEEI